MVGFLAAVVAVYLAWLGLLFVFQRRIIYPTAHAVPLEDAGRGVKGLERLWHETEAGHVEAWFVPGLGVSAERPGPLVVFAHGNAELIEHAEPALRRYRQLGVSVLLGEYRGYGRSAGSPSEAGIVEDMAALWDRVTARPEVDRERVVFHGRSLGAAVACSLARQRPPRALILESAFTSTAAMAHGLLAPGFLVRDQYDNLGLLRSFAAPVLILHGRYDATVPFSHAQELAAAAQQATLVEYDCGHNDLPSDPEHYWGQIEQFLRDSDVLH